MDITVKRQYSPAYRLKAWNAIQTRCPATADFMAECNKRFGKFAEIRFVTDDHDE
tara:strand:- start:1742 stop:1906 length:165 start_codon:yes stop_codon:yes gene_type:complete